MAVVRSSEEVFLFYKQKYGLDDDGDVHAVALFAFSVVENERMDWMAHAREMRNADPTEHQISEWYASKPQSYFDEIGKGASLWLHGFAKILLADEIERSKRQAVKDEIGQLGRFWPQFWIGNLVGVTSNIFFALLIVLFVIYIGSDFSFIAWAKKFLPIGH